MNPRARATALVLKTAAFGVGVMALALSVAYLFGELSFLAGSNEIELGDVVAVLATVSLAFAGFALVAQLPESLRARFRRIPTSGAKRRPVYGFGTMLAVGVGATIGSPLFILIPENILQYEIVSIVSLLLAAALSIALARVYATLYKETSAMGMAGVGGPSFTKAAVGVRSVRYFISRVSMWVSNTALAAYSEIVFLLFIQNPQYLPSVLAGFGFDATMTKAVTLGVAGIFVGWTVLNVFFEKRYLKLLGLVQIVATSTLVAILVYHSLALGFANRWTISGLFEFGSGAGWIPALLINTGYLYLLFFGFQEIQSLERDSVEESRVPIISWVRRSFTLDRKRYFGLAMMLSVAIAAAVNILYGLAVSAYAAHTPVASSAIPAIFIARTLPGRGQELLVMLAFLIATVTTFVPAFLGAARHLGALGEDGYMPKSLASLSWVFTLVGILLLAIGNQGFLVEITDFMVLISLGIISFSALWLKGGAGQKRPGRGLPLLVGAGCFVFAGAVYALNPSVVVFGSVAIILAYLIFDIFELGTLGAQMFLAIFGFMSVLTLTAVKHTLHPGGTLALLTTFTGADPNLLLFWTLLVSSVLLSANVLLDVRILRRTSLQ